MKIQLKSFRSKFLLNYWKHHKNHTKKDSKAKKSFKSPTFSPSFWSHLIFSSFSKWWKLRLSSLQRKENLLPLAHNCSFIHEKSREVKKETFCRHLNFSIRPQANGKLLSFLISLLLVWLECISTLRVTILEQIFFKFLKKALRMPKALRIYLFDVIMLD